MYFQCWCNPVNFARNKIANVFLCLEQYFRQCAALKLYWATTQLRVEVLHHCWPVGAREHINSAARYLSVQNVFAQGLDISNVATAEVDKNHSLSSSSRNRCADQVFIRRTSIHMQWKDIGHVQARLSLSCILLHYPATAFLSCHIIIDLHARCLLNVREAASQYSRTR